MHLSRKNLTETVFSFLQVFNTVIFTLLQRPIYWEELTLKWYLPGGLKNLSIQKPCSKLNGKFYLNGTVIKNATVRKKFILRAYLKSS